MKYFELLGMTREPFSATTDPVFFFPTPEHTGCILRLEKTLQFRGGLSLILGDSGTGKTTLGRVIRDRFRSRNNNLDVHLILKPYYSSEYQFLQELSKTFGIEARFRSTLEYQNAILDQLFRKVIEEGKVVVLMIDEGHKLTSSSLEVLRGLLKHQFEGFQLLHLVIFSRMKFLERIRRRREFEGWMNLKYTINPLDPEELKELILHRLKVAGCKDSGSLFEDLAFYEIWRFSKGNPSIANVMCHHSLLCMTMRRSETVDLETVRTVAKNWRIQP